MKGSAFCSFCATFLVEVGTEDFSAATLGSFDFLIRNICCLAQLNKFPCLACSFAFAFPSHFCTRLFPGAFLLLLCCGGCLSCKLVQLSAVFARTFGIVNGVHVSGQVCAPHLLS